MTTNIEIPYHFTPRPYQVKLFNCIDDGYKRAVAIFHRRCLGGDSHVIMSNGSWKLLKNVNKGDRILSWDGGNFVIDKVKDIWKTGVKQGYSVKVKGCKNFEASKDHKYLTSRQGYSMNWETLKSIKHPRRLYTYDKLACGTIHNPELAELIGYLITDGSVNKDQSPKFTNINMEMVERVALLTKRIFGYVGKYHKKGNGWDLILSNGTRGGGKTPNKVKEFFRENDALEKKSNRRVPKILWDMDEESLWAFFGAVISGDGNIYCQKNGRMIDGKNVDRAVDIKISVGESINLMWDYYWLLRKLGIFAGDAKKDNRVFHNNHIVRIWTREYINKLLLNIRTIGKEDKRKEAILLTSKYEPRVKYQGNTCLYSITSKEDKDIDTYDLETEANGCFIADGYVVHNSGKDKTCINIMVSQLLQRVGIYYYFFPTYSQGRKILWDGMDKDGFPFLGHIPEGIRALTNNQEMKIKFKNGSLFQVVGTDDIDRVVGTNPVGNIFSEYALQNPIAYDYIRPIIKENNGWAIFPYTPRGRNHGYTLYNMALHNPDWFAELLTIKDTGVLTEADMDKERAEGMSEELIQQEYYCSFSASQTMQLIPFEVVNRGVECHYDAHVYRDAPIVVGVDVARFGDDKSAICVRQGLHVHEIHKFQDLDTMELASQVAQVQDAWQPDQTFIDIVGLGAGVYDRLNQLGRNVCAVNAGMKPDNPIKYFNKRIEMWDKCNQWLAEGGSIPNDKELIADLTNPTYSFNSREQMVLERKEKMKERGVGSPDTGESVVYTFAENVQLDLSNEDYDYYHRERYIGSTSVTGY